MYKVLLRKFRRHSRKGSIRRQKFSYWGPGNFIDLVRTTYRQLNAHHHCEESLTPFTKYIFFNEMKPIQEFIHIYDTIFERRTIHISGWLISRE